MSTAGEVFTDYLQRRHVPAAEVGAMLTEAEGLLEDMSTTDGAVDTSRVRALAQRYRRRAGKELVQTELDRRFGKDRPKPAAKAETGQQRDGGGRFSRTSTGRAEAARRFGAGP